MREEMSSPSRRSRAVAPISPGQSRSYPRTWIGCIRRLSRCTGSSRRGFRKPLRTIAPTAPPSSGDTLELRATTAAQREFQATLMLSTPRRDSLCPARLHRTLITKLKTATIVTQSSMRSMLRSFALRAVQSMRRTPTCSPHSGSNAHMQR